MTKVLNAQSHPLTEAASISHRNLRDTILESKADPNKIQKDEVEVDLNSCLAKVKPEVKYTAALMRSSRIRGNCNYLPETAVKQRKSYYCTNETGFLNQKYTFNQMAML
jgi:hypothetical protein